MRAAGKPADAGNANRARAHGHLGTFALSELRAITQPNLPLGSLIALGAARHTQLTHSDNPPRSLTQIAQPGN